jgi:polyisoprenyl-phosphate glycosyltransferase
MVIESDNTAHHGPAGAGNQHLLSIIVPCWNEELNIPLLYARLRAVLGVEQIDWEMIVVDDHSRDRTFEVASGLAEQDCRVRVFRLSRNVGSHLALMCGLEHALGQAAIMIAADMQDPPEIISEMLKCWRRGDQVVWAVRTARKGVSAKDVFMSRLFYRIMAGILGRSDLSGHGADVFLIDRIVIEAVTQCREGNVSLFALLAWLGFRQNTIPYVKEERKHGRSGWTLSRKLKLFVDSITAFSYLPIRLMSLVGIGTACVGFLYALIVTSRAFLVEMPVEGWSSLMIVVLVIGGLQMTMLGTLGEYLWRTLDETRRRPRYNIECAAGRSKHPVRKFSISATESTHLPREFDGGIHD